MEKFELWRRCLGSCGGWHHLKKETCNSCVSKHLTCSHTHTHHIHTNSHIHSVYSLFKNAEHVRLVDTHFLRFILSFLFCSFFDFWLDVSAREFKYASTSECMFVCARSYSPHSVLIFKCSVLGIWRFQKKFVLFCF